MEEATLLGAPILAKKGMDTLLEKRCSELQRALDRLEFISKHDALLILKSAISAPKLIYTLRSSACTDHPALDSFDSLLRNGLSKIINIQVDDIAWIQASLPVRDGGLGIRSVASLAPSAFLASAAATLGLQTAILRNCNLPEDLTMQATMAIWSSKYNQPAPVENLTQSQKSWDIISIQADKNTVTASFTDPQNNARIAAVSAPHASDWLSAMPITACGLRLDDEAIRIAVALRLGVPICEPHLCHCGSQVNAMGTHGLSCKKGTGRMSRHQLINDITFRAATKAGVPVIKEPAGLSRTDGKRPDGVTLFPWREGRSLAWDVTVIDTFAASYLTASADHAGGAAEIAAKRKTIKYSSLPTNYEFCPIAFETMGPINEEGCDFISAIGAA